MFNLHLLCTVRAMHPITSLNYDLRGAQRTQRGLLATTSRGMTRRVSWRRRPAGQPTMPANGKDPTKACRPQAAARGLRTSVCAHACLWVVSECARAWDE